MDLMLMFGLWKIKKINKGCWEWWLCQLHLPGECLNKQHWLLCLESTVWSYWQPHQAFLVIPWSPESVGNKNVCNLHPPRYRYRGQQRLRGAEREKATWMSKWRIFSVFCFYFHFYPKHIYAKGARGRIVTLPFAMYWTLALGWQQPPSCFNDSIYYVVFFPQR